MYCVPCPFGTYLCERMLVSVCAQGSDAVVQIKTKSAIYERETEFERHIEVLQCCRIGLNPASVSCGKEIGDQT